MPDIMSVIVGGLLGGGAMWAQQRWKAREDWRVKQAEKFEELLTAIEEHNRWVLDRNLHKEDTEHSDMSDKIERTCIIYFPTNRDTNEGVLECVSRLRAAGRIAF